MNIISSKVFEQAAEIYDLLEFCFNDAVKELFKIAKGKSFEDCEELLLELCNDYEKEEGLLILRNFI